MAENRLSAALRAVPAHGRQYHYIRAADLAFPLSDERRQQLDHQVFLICDELETLANEAIQRDIRQQEFEEIHHRLSMLGHATSQPLLEEVQQAFVERLRRR
ncbi:hypothetical protein ACLE20_04740 [Rhizobium sp. YIM 134829]|uniref:hypothetical protein n=1 Tax=Rhizobium sp. YIM 134829 TaxID=3390453 RepID=UPI003978C8A6